MKNVCVFCSSKLGSEKVYAGNAALMGKLLAQNGFGLVFGGVNIGFMNIVASAVADNGGKVISIVPDEFHDMSFERSSEIILVENLAQRKRRMIALSNAFVALPGGIGTLNEITEVACQATLGHCNKPMVLLNTGGFYNTLQYFFAKMWDQGMLDRQYFFELASECQDVINILTKTT